MLGGWDEGQQPAPLSLHSSSAQLGETLSTHLPFQKFSLIFRGEV